MQLTAKLLGSRPHASATSSSSSVNAVVPSASSPVSTPISETPLPPPVELPSKVVIPLGNVENSHTRLPSRSQAETSERLRNFGKPRYPTNAYGEDIRGESQLPVNKIEEQEPRMRTLRPVGQAPAGAHFFFKSYPSVNDPRLRAAWQIEKCDNAFIKAAVMAFAEHLPLRLKPDHILELLVSGFNTWLNEFGGAEELQQRGIVGERQRVQVDFDPSDWDSAIDCLGGLLAQSITNEDLRCVLLAKFSTTTSEMRRAHSLTIASAFKKFVEVHFNTLCGIPSVTLEGTREDWADLKLVANALAAVSHGKLARWTDAVQAALDVMLASVDGEDTAETWRNFINHSQGSGFSGCSGWINSFFPYVRNYQHELVANPAIWNEDAGFLQMSTVTHDRDEELPRVSYSLFLSSFARDEYAWTDVSVERRLLISAGLVDAIQWEDDAALEPFLSFQVDVFQ